MGLFDGVGATTEASTAEVATQLHAPVVLVVDASAMSGSVAALVHGFHDHLRQLARPRGSPGSSSTGSAATPTSPSCARPSLGLGLPVLGALRRNADLTWRDRHLGLVPVVEQPDEARRSIERLGRGCGAPPSISTR